MILICEPFSFEYNVPNWLFFENPRSFLIPFSKDPYQKSKLRLHENIVQPSSQMVFHFSETGRNINFKIFTVADFVYNYQPWSGFINVLSYVCAT